MTTLELRLLGGLSINQDSAPLTALKSKKGQALLSYLAVTGKEHTRSAIAGLLWSDVPEKNARANLRKTLSRLKPHLGSYLNITRESIALRQEADYWLDVSEFESGVAPGVDIQQLQGAVSLYQGDFLEGFDLPDAPLFDEWVLAQRARLRDMALGALRKLTTYFTGQGETEKAVEYARSLLKIEPWHEGTHRQLMRLLALSGQRSAALKQYERCRRMLADELGVEPGEETSSLYERIRDGELAPTGEPPSDETSFGPVPFPSNVPPQPTGFVGRERELDELDDLIIQRRARLVTLVGPGGIGKTRLAIEFAGRQLPSRAQNIKSQGQTTIPFPNGVYFASLESLESEDLILPAIAEALRYRLDRGEAQLVDYLSSKRLLLVLDNFEHLLDGAEILSRILRSAPDVHILVTSRESLRLHQEQVFPLQGLNFWEPLQIGSAADYSAGKLFLQAARRQQPGYTLDGAEEMEALARLCRLVEGMPLALELAAAWSDTLPLSAIVTEIQHNFDFLATEFRDIPARHRSVRAVVDVSWEQLKPAEQNLFAQLSVFRGGFTRQAAAAVTGSTVQDLSALVGKSLLRYSQPQDRYYLHELLRQYGAEKLGIQAQKVEGLRDRHSQYYCQWFADQDAPDNLKSVGQKTVLDAMAAELENTRAAWKWAIENQRIKPLMGSISAVGRYYIWRGGFQEGERVLRTFLSNLAAGDSSADADRALIRADALIWQAFFLYELGDRMKSIDLLHESQDLLNSPTLVETDTRALRAHNLVNLMRADWSQPDEVRFERLAQARAWYREVDHPFGLPFVLNSSARLAILTGRLDRAQQFLEESLEIYQRTGNQIGRAISLTGLGNLAFARNDYAKSESLLRQSAAIARQMESPERVTIASMYRGAACLHSGQFRQAQRILEKCVSDSVDLGLQPYKATALYYLGYVHLHLGRYDRAIECGKEALPLAEQSDDEEIVSQSLTLPAAVDLAKGAFDEAWRGFEQAARAQGARRTARVLFGEDCGQLGLAAALLQLGRMGEAQTIIGALLRDAVASQRQDKLLYALVGMAVLSVGRGEVEGGLELYSLAASYPFVGFSRWFSDAFGTSIQAAGAQFPPANVEAATGKDGQRDLWGIADELLRECGDL